MEYYHHILWDGTTSFGPPRSLSMHMKCLPCHKDGKYTTSCSFNRVYFHSVLAIKMSSVQLFTLFLWLVFILTCRSPNVDRSPAINVQSWSLFVSCFRKYKQGAGNECPTWSSSSHLGRCEQEAVVNAQPGVHLSPASIPLLFIRSVLPTEQSFQNTLKP